MMTNLNNKIIDWHICKFPKADKWDVYRKLLEEVGELGEAMARNIDKNIELELGDVMICIIALSNQLQINIEDAVKQSHKKNLMRQV